MKNLFLNLMILLNVSIIMACLIFLTFVVVIVFSISEAFCGFAESILTLAI